ncbi:argininosuccinate synthase [bacterium]|nr:argininosuccinate synthase [bacterium]
MPEKKLAVLAFSGGLDTSYCAMYLSKQLQYRVHTVFVDTGGHTAEELAAMEQQALLLGAEKHVTLQRTQEFYSRCIRFLVFGNVLRGNSYPLSVSAERVFQAEAIAAYARDQHADAIAHGSTGAGNDQVRFDTVFRIILPEARIITPVRDMSLSREQEIAYLQEAGVDMDAAASVYSINAGLWGTSIGGRETLQSDGVLPETAYPVPQTAIDERKVTLHFTQGEVDGIDGHSADSISVIRQLEDLAAPYGIGRGMHVGDTIIGLKGRVGFAAAAPHVIIAAHRLLEKHTLTRQQQLMKEQVALTYGSLVHEAQFLEPAARDIEALLLSTQRHVTGEVDILLAPHRFDLLGIRSDHDLLSTDFGTYGEENSLWNGEDVRGFSKIYANQLMMYFTKHRGSDAI